MRTMRTMRTMRKQQLGVSLGGLVAALFIFIIVGLLALKVIPAYLEYGSIKKAVVSIAAEKSTGNVAEIRKAFDSRAAIDDFTAVKGADLEVTKEGGQVVIRAAYRKEVPLFANIGIFWDFDASSKDQ